MPVAIGRRELIAALGGVVAAWPVSARAQQPAMPVVGLLLSGPPDTDRLAWFRHGLKEAGYVEGQNYSTEYRAANNRYERLPELATDLVRREVAVIVVPGTTAAALAAKAATRTIPIIFVIGSDPVEAGLVTSLARPGGNVTGLGALHFTMATKRLELLHEVVPTPALIALLVNPSNPYTEQETREVQAAAHGLGIQLRVLNAINEVDIDAAFAALVQQRIGAVLVGADPFFTSLRSQIV